MGARPEDLAGLYRWGDASSQPGAPTVGASGVLPVGDIHALADFQPVMWRPFNGVLAAGEVVTLNSDDRPDYWIVTVSHAVAGVTLTMWPYVVPGGTGIVIGAGGSARLPGLDHHLTLRAGVGVTAYSAVAVRGFDLASISYGD